MIQKKSRILVDGNCIVCSWEIAHYKRKAPELFEIVDITHPDFKAEAYGLNADKVQKHMHVLGPEGELYVGVDAFAHIWSRLPRWKLASVCIKAPLVYQAAKVFYEGFARIRPWLPKKDS
jgi:predicted DCC family thiol-disulfide oxidoreductase YuxK